MNTGALRYCTLHVLYISPNCVECQSDYFLHMSPGPLPLIISRVEYYPCVAYTARPHERKGNINARRYSEIRGEITKSSRSAQGCQMVYGWVCSYKHCNPLPLVTSYDFGFFIHLRDGNRYSSAYRPIMQPPNHRLRFLLPPTLAVERFSTITAARLLPHSMDPAMPRQHHCHFTHRPASCSP